MNRLLIEEDNFFFSSGREWFSCHLQVNRGLIYISHFFFKPQYHSSLQRNKPELDKQLVEAFKLRLRRELKLNLIWKGWETIKIYN